MASVTKNLSSGSAGLEPTIGDQIKPIPFRTELSLAPLLAFWARAFGDDTSLEGTFARTIREVTEPETGLDRHFKGQFDLRFVEVVPVGPTPPLTEEVRRRLHGNLLDADFLRQILPPENFVFRGFAIFKAVEVTDQEVLSSLKR